MITAETFRYYVKLVDTIEQAKQSVDSAIGKIKGLSLLSDYKDRSEVVLPLLEENSKLLHSDLKKATITFCEKAFSIKHPNINDWFTIMAGEYYSVDTETLKEQQQRYEKMCIYPVHVNRLRLSKKRIIKMSSGVSVFTRYKSIYWFSCPKLAIEVHRNNKNAK